MSQNSKITISLSDKIDILNRTQSIDARYGVYDSEALALASMANYGLDGRQVAVYVDKPNGLIKLYTYNQVLHRLDPISAETPTLQEVIDKSANGGTYVFASFPSGNEIEDDGGGLTFKGDIGMESANGEEIIKVKDSGTTAILEGTTGNNGDFLVNVDGNGRVGWRKLLDDTVISLTKLWSSQKISDELASKVDKVTGKGLSPEEFTLLEKQKLAGLEGSKWRGVYITKTALELANPTPEGGDYADVDAGTGVDTIRYIYDESDDEWIESGSGAPLTAAQIKQMYESNPDTNAFTDSLKSWLQGMSAQFTTALKNSYDNVVTWITTNGQNVLDHINSPHAPADAQKNSDITKGEIEAKLTGNITSHTHSYVDLTSDQSIGGVKSFTDNVGIGTSTPRTSLEIYNDSTVADDLPAGAGGSRGTALLLRSNPSVDTTRPGILQYGMRTNGDIQYSLQTAYIGTGEDNLTHALTIGAYGQAHTSGNTVSYGFLGAESDTAWNNATLKIDSLNRIGIALPDSTRPSTSLDVNGVITATGGNSTRWNSAFSWGNHTGLYSLLGHTHDIQDVLGLADALNNKEDSFSKGSLIAGTNISLSGTLANRLIGSGNITVNADVSGMRYIGTWDASENEPTLSDSTGEEGNFYRVIEGGTVDLGNGNITFVAGDDVIHNGVSWERAPSSNSVISVNGHTGTVVLDKSDWNATSGDAEILNKPTKTSEFENDGETGVSEYIEFADLDASTLPNMAIDSNWTIKKNNGDVLGTSSSNNLNVDKGSKVDLVTSWKWNTLSAGQLAPTSTSGDISGTTLPSENTFSSPPLSETDIITTTTFSQTMRKPKSGLEVVNGQVVVAEGNDTKSINTKVSFLGRGGLFYSTSTNPTSNQIEAEINDGSFWASRARTLNNVTATGGKYTYIVYDAALGEWNNIIMDDAESQTGAFTKLTNVTITNNAGIAIEMIIYKSNAPDAFANNKLTIS